MIKHELINDEIILHEILQHILEWKIMVDGDDEMIHHPTDTIHEILEVKDSDHAHHDGIYLVDENGLL